MRIQLIFAAALALLASACNAAGNDQSVPSTTGGSTGIGASEGIAPNAVDHTSILKMLTTQAVIGSTVDPTNGDQNPYGLVYVNSKPFGNGVLKKGDLVTCNFNDSANVQGNGTTLEYMPAVVGSTPTRLIQNAQLKGCASLVINSLDAVYATDSGAKNATGISPAGKIRQTLKSSSLLVEPWGSAYIASGLGYPPGDGLWVSDASTGKIVRIDLGTSSGKPKYTAVITGFAVNHGAPGSILGPSGLQYDAKAKTLYIVDGVNDTVVAIKDPYDNLNQAGSIVVGSTGKTFAGPKAKDARLVFSGPPLNGPISAALLPNGNLVLGNTLNRNGKNYLIEIATDGTVLATKNVDTGAAGSIFGVVATGTNDDNALVYFNDDNHNNIRVLER
ncbi:MAG: hypothetical protein WB615_12625 [Candidatus Tumulicola sp.]